MKAKRICYSEAAYALGIVILALGTALMEKADLGMSMVVAPAYLLYRAVSPHAPFFTFGMAEYVFQAFLLIVLSIVLKKGKKSYLFSFVTAVLYGLVLDLAMVLLRGVPVDGIALRLVFFLAGFFLGSVGVAFFFHSYITPEAYELFVKEISRAYGYPLDRVKTVYDCCSCLAGILLSFLFFGLWHFEGVKLGTVFCAVTNGWLIGRVSHVIERVFTFRDAFPLRDLFSK